MRELGKRAGAIVTDDFPSFFLPRMIEAVGRKVPVTMEAIDSNGIYPMRDTDRVFSRAHYFRRHLQKTILPFIEEFPDRDPLLRKKLPKLGPIDPKIAQRWPKARLNKGKIQLAKFPIDHDVAVSKILPGGVTRATKRLDTFV